MVQKIPPGDSNVTTVKKKKVVVLRAHDQNWLQERLFGAAITQEGTDCRLGKCPGRVKLQVRQRNPVGDLPLSQGTAATSQSFLCYQQGPGT